MQISISQLGILDLFFLSTFINLVVTAFRFFEVLRKEKIMGYEEKGIFSLAWTVHIFIQIGLTLGFYFLSKDFLSQQEVTTLLSYAASSSISFQGLLALNIFIKYENGAHWSRIVILVVLFMFLLFISIPIYYTL